MKVERGVRGIKMSKRKDDRDADKSYDKATDDPWEAQETGGSEQAAELQVGEEGERATPSRFEPDPEAERPSPDHKGVKDAPLKEDAVDEP
jgi:hypothetical protein